MIMLSPIHVKFLVSANSEKFFSECLIYTGPVRNTSPCCHQAYISQKVTVCQIVTGTMRASVKLAKGEKRGGQEGTSRSGKLWTRCSLFYIFGWGSLETLEKEECYTCQILLLVYLKENLRIGH